MSYCIGNRSLISSVEVRGESRTGGNKRSPDDGDERVRPAMMRPNSPIARVFHRHVQEQALSMSAEGNTLHVSAGRRGGCEASYF